MQTRDVQLQPYAVEALHRYCPCLWKILPPSRIVRLNDEQPDRFTISIPEQKGYRELAFPCPPQFRDLFYRDPKASLPAEKVVDLLRSGYETWLKKIELAHPLQLPCD